jgi:hypothetical protein
VAFRKDNVLRYPADDWVKPIYLCFLPESAQSPFTFNLADME